MPLNCGEELDRRPPDEAVRWPAADHSRPCRQPDASRCQGAHACQYRNACWLGCPLRRVLQHTVVHASGRRCADGTPHAQTVRHRDRGALRQRQEARNRRSCARCRQSNQTTDYTARVVFLCASTLNSTWLLMRSATDVWPGGLGSSSGELGHNLMDHHFRCGANGGAGGARRQATTTAGGPRASTSRAIEICSATSASTCAASDTRVARAGKDGQRAVAELGVGAAFKDATADAGTWRIGATAFGEMLPNHANQVSLDRDEEGQVGPAGAGRSTARSARTSVSCART